MEPSFILIQMFPGVVSKSGSDILCCTTIRLETTNYDDLFSEKPYHDQDNICAQFDLNNIQALFLFHSSTVIFKNKVRR